MTSSFISKYQNNPVIAPLLKEFVEDIPESLGRIEYDLKSQNFVALKESCHKLAGASATYGYESMSLILLELERHIRDQIPNPDFIEQQLGILWQHHKGIANQLKKGSFCGS